MKTKTYAIVYMLMLQMQMSIELYKITGVVFN